MNANALIRQVHRWLSIAFTVGFATNVAMLATGGKPALWIGLLALAPLLLLLFSGLYLFALPYLVKGRAPQRIAS